MNPDFKDLLSEFNAAGVEYIVVGAHAMAAHGFVRATKDLDVWVKPDPSNATKAIAALSAFGAPLYDLTVDDLATEGTVFQIGIAPVRIDIITSIHGVEFSQAWEERMDTLFAGESVHVLSRRHLITNKKASGRLQDLADVERLEGLRKKGES